MGWCRVCKYWYWKYMLHSVNTKYSWRNSKIPDFCNSAQSTWNHLVCMRIYFKVKIMLNLILNPDGAPLRASQLLYWRWCFCIDAWVDQSLEFNLNLPWPSRSPTNQQVAVPSLAWLSVTVGLIIYCAIRIQSGSCIYSYLENSSVFGI